jgi:hypothetical protein
MSNVSIQNLFKSVVLVVLVLGTGGCLPIARGCLGVLVEVARDGKDASTAPIASSGGTGPAPVAAGLVPLSDDDESADEIAEATAGLGEAPDDDEHAGVAPAPPTTTSTAGGMAAAAPGKQGSFTCNAQGYYMKCPNNGYCMSNLATSMGAGSTQATASGMAEALCNKHMSSMVSINNIGGRAYVSSPCRTISCSSR